MNIIRKILCFIGAMLSTVTIITVLFGVIIILRSDNPISEKVIVLGIFTVIALVPSCCIAVLFYKSLFCVQKKALKNTNEPLYANPRAQASGVIPEVPQNTQYINSHNVHPTDSNSLANNHLTANRQSVVITNSGISNLIRQITESYQIICKTNDPETLCSRYNLIVKRVNELSALEQQNLLDQNTLNQYKTLITDDNHYNLIISCYQKYIAKAHSELKTQNGVNKRINKFWKIIHDNVSTEFYNTKIRKM